MDPLSITTGVLSLVGTGIKAIQTFQSVAAKYSLADLTIVSIRTECTSIRLALSQIQGIIARQPSLRDATTSDDSGDEMWEEYRVALDACSITFNILSDRLSNLKMDDVDEYNATTAKSRIKAVMNSEEMGCLVQNIRGQALALALLLQVFQAAATGRTQLLQQERSSVILQNVTENARSLIGSVRRSRAGSSGFSVQSSIIGDEEFDFDDEVVNSRAYRRIMARRRVRRGGNARDDDVKQNEERPPKLANELDRNELNQLDNEEGIEVPGHRTLLLESNPPEDEEGENDWWQTRNAAPERPTSSNFADNSGSYLMPRLIFLDVSSERNPEPDTDWRLRREQETRELPHEPPTPTNNDRQVQESADSDTSLSLEVDDIERERVVTNLRNRVEDWKNHNPNNFGKLMLWGEYQIIANGHRKTFLVYLFEAIFICCQELKGQRPGNLTSRAPFLRKMAGPNHNPEIVPDPNSSRLRLTGRIFIRTITECIRGIDENGLYTLHVFWKDIVSGDFIIKYRTEEEMARWAAQVNELQKKLNVHKLRHKRIEAPPMIVLKAPIEIEGPAEMGGEDVAEGVFEDLEDRTVPRYDGWV